VRILSPVLGDKMQTGTAVSTTKESIMFQAKLLDAPQAVGKAQITKMDVSQGTHSHKLKDAGLGLVIGGAVAAGITAMAWRKKGQGSGLDFGRVGDSEFAGVFGGALGAFTGLVIGARQTDNWAPVEIPPSPIL
jgi:hypothetical protein